MVILPIVDEESDSQESDKNCNIFIVPKEDEECVICGKKTGVNRKTPVAYRKYYVECCGQLCRECFESLFSA